MRLFILLIILTLNVSTRLVFAQPIPLPVDIPIQNRMQETSVWCWAAVAQQIVMASKGPMNTPPQCALVAMANGAHPSFCCNGFNSACIKTGSIQQIQFLIAQFGGHFSSYAPPTNPMILYNTLSSGRPIILQLNSGNGNAHVVVVRGMSFMPTAMGIQPVLHINDPMAVFTQPVPFAQIAPIWMSAIVVN
jgi:Papain-like cysteine protease AvrRpt2